MKTLLIVSAVIFAFSFTSCEKETTVPVSYKNRSTQDTIISCDSVHNMPVTDKRIYKH